MRVLEKRNAKWRPGALPQACLYILTRVVRVNVKKIPYLLNPGDNNLEGNFRDKLIDLFSGLKKSSDLKKIFPKPFIFIDALNRSSRKINSTNLFLPPPHVQNFSEIKCFILQRRTLFFISLLLP